MFTRQLHVRHTTENTSPRLRAAVIELCDAAILNAVQAEYATVDPLIDSADKAAHLRARRGNPDGVGQRMRDVRALQMGEES
jgi:hypothetical protein